jgi:hypothetical protein
VEATAKGDVNSRREAPRRAPIDHLSPKIKGDINEITTQSRSRNISHFVSFNPKDIGHTLSDSNWVNAMHVELENFERNQVWKLVKPPPNCHPIGTKWVWKNKESEDEEVV